MTSCTSHASPVTRRRRARGWRLALVLAGILAAVIVTGWTARAPLLRSAAEAWIAGDDPEPADAVAVLGGGLDTRPFAAADYYRRALVKKVLISNVGADPAERLGVLSSHVEYNRRVLLKLGVPESAIEPVGENLANTYQEVRALRDWATRTKARSIIVPTEVFSTRRVRWTLHRVLGGTVVIRVTALAPYGYDRDNWWQHEAGVIAFQNEVIKYLYYRMKY
jgi:uncharacterized SAM-binding protein YcdF (DUF218 family)